MEDRAELHRRFADRFHSGKRTRPAAVDQVEAVEASLGILWPESYRQFALTCGAVFCPSVLDLIVERKAKFADVQQFLTPRQSATETKRWRLEPAGKCLIFASDGSGNWFAFRDLAATPPRLDDAAVWFFDLEGGTVEVESATFDEWLERFLGL